MRGNPGTHDVAWLRRTLQAVRDGASSAVEVPVYDKTAHRGRGDRCATRRRLRHPLRVLLVEGWCVGFTPDGDDDVVHRALADAYVPLWRDFLDATIVLRPPDLDVVYEWRREAETRMDDASVRDFVDAYMPLYRACLPRLYATAASEKGRGGWLLLDVDASRSTSAV